MEESEAEAHHLQSLACTTQHLGHCRVKVSVSMSWTIKGHFAMLHSQGMLKLLQAEPAVADAWHHSKCSARLLGLVQ